MIIYRGYYINHRDDFKWDILNKEKLVIHVAVSEEAAYNWIDDEKKGKHK